MIAVAWLHADGLAGTARSWLGGWSGAPPIPASGAAIGGWVHELPAACPDPRPTGPWAWGTPLASMVGAGYDLGDWLDRMDARHAAGDSTFPTLWYQLMLWPDPEPGDPDHADPDAVLAARRARFAGSHGWVPHPGWLERAMGFPPGWTGRAG